MRFHLLHFTECERDVHCFHSRSASRSAVLRTTDGGRNSTGGSWNAKADEVGSLEALNPAFCLLRSNLCNMRRSRHIGRLSFWVLFMLLALSFPRSSPFQLIGFNAKTDCKTAVTGQSITRQYHVVNLCLLILLKVCQWRLLWCSVRSPIRWSSVLY